MQHRRSPCSLLCRSVRLTDEPPVRVSGWFPLVGLVLAPWRGLLVEALEWVGSYTGSPLVVATMVVVLWAVVTRLLHWDGSCRRRRRHVGRSHERQDRVRNHGRQLGRGVRCDRRRSRCIHAGRRRRLPLPWARAADRCARGPASRSAERVVRRLARHAREARRTGRDRIRMSRALDGVRRRSVVGAIAWLLWASLEVRVWPVAARWTSFSRSRSRMYSRDRCGGVTGDVMGASVLIMRDGSAVDRRCCVG